MKKITKNRFNIINFIGLTISGIVNSVGAILFLYPLKIYDSGISGLSMLLDQVTPPFLTVSIFLIAFNLPIFLFGYKKQGLVFTVYSIYAILIYSVFAFLFQNIFFDLTQGVSPIGGNELILCSIFGGIISGVGSGLAIRFGGAMDGLDILSVIFAKKVGISVGNFILCFNIVLYIICGFVTKSWVLPLYSIIAYFCGAKTVDYVVEGISRSITAIIITEQPEKVSKALLENFDETCTIIDAIGGFSKEPKSILYFNVNHFQVSKLRTLVHSIDSKAYITLQDVADIIEARKN